MINTKFITRFIDGAEYVDAADIINIYRKIPGKSKSSQKRLIKNLNLKNTIKSYKFVKYNIKINFISKLLDDLRPKTKEIIYLELNELENPNKENRNKDIHLELLRLINFLPDFGTEPDSETDSETDVEPDSEPNSEPNLIIQFLRSM